MSYPVLSQTKNLCMSPCPLSLKIKQHLRPKEENSVDPYDFVSNLRSAIQKEISVIMDIDGVYPDYSYSQKRRMQNQISALVDMIDVQPYSPSANRRFLPQQLMGWKTRDNETVDGLHGLKRLKQWDHDYLLNFITKIDIFQDI